MRNILPGLLLLLAVPSLAVAENATEDDFLADNYAIAAFPNCPVNGLVAEQLNDLADGSFAQKNISSGYGSFTEHLNDSGNGSLAERLKDHVTVLASDSLEGRGLGTRGKVLAKNYIANHFRSFGLNKVDGDYFQHFEMRVGLAWVQGSNVIGYLKGADPDLQSEFIVIGAHYDHLGYEYKNGQRIIYPGADDNASGTSSLIELARYFSQNREKIGRSIIFIAFDAEESGLIGSEKFLNMSGAFGEHNIKAMFSLDMVGMYGVHSGLNLQGMGALDGGVELAERLAAEYNINLKNTSAEIEYRTDTRPFGELGIPAVHASTGSESPYHKPGDTHGLLDYDGMAEVTGYLEALVTGMSQESELNPSRRFVSLQGPYALRFDAGVIAHAGSSHHSYAEEFFRAENVFAFSAGMFMQLHIGQRFSVQPEILYDFNGSKSAGGIFRRHSFMVPVNLHMNLVNEAAGLIRLYMVTGGYYRYNLAGKHGGAGLDFNSINPRQDWGINLGFGADIMDIQVNYLWRRGLTEIFPESVSRVFESGHYISLGYKF